MRAKAQPYLTPRELEIVKLIWQELTAKEIAAKLRISPRTVEAHRWNVCQKIGAKTSVGIVKFALRTGIVKL